MTPTQAPYDDRPPTNWTAATMVAAALLPSRGPLIVDEHDLHALVQAVEHGTGWRSLSARESIRDVLDFPAHLAAWGVLAREMPRHRRRDPLRVEFLLSPRLATEQVLARRLLLLHDLAGPAAVELARQIAAA